MPTRAIKAVFFTRFHHEKGSRVLHQVPEGSITPSSSPSSLPQPLIPFDSISPYLIPTQQFCDRLLTFCVNHHRVIGYPVCIREGRYSRNEFIFNFAIVIEENAGSRDRSTGAGGSNNGEWQAYGEVARKIGCLLRGLEEQGGFLTAEEEEWGAWDDDNSGGGEGVGRREGVVGEGSKVYAICEMILEDLNNYAECMIPIDESNTINLKLFPTHPPPPPISASQVPLLTISLASLTTPISSDLTLMRIVPFINGIHSVARIAALADTDLSLTRKALQHLIYYGCLILLDIFSFGAVYAPTAEIGGFIVDKGVQEECARYVRAPSASGRNPSQKPASHDARTGSSSTDPDSYRPHHYHHNLDPTRSSSSDTIHTTRTTSTASSSNLDPPSPSRSPGPLPNPLPGPTPETLITLYTSLRQGLPLRNFVLDNLFLLSGIDIRRFITFGVIKGFLYRIHKYAILTTPPQSHPPPPPPTSLKSSGILSGAASDVLSGGGDDVGGAGNALSSLVGGGGGTAGPASNLPHTFLHKPSVSNIGQQHTASGVNEPITRLDSIVSELSLHQQQRGGRGGGMGGRTDGGPGSGGGLPLVRFLDGMHCFDEICIDLGMSEKDVEAKIRGAGEVNIFYR